MAVRKVAAMGHPILRKKALPVKEEDIRSPAIRQLIHDMVDTMWEYNGRGLAAPQVHESLQIVVMLWDFTPGEEPVVRCLINPKIELLTKETSSYWEGCLSVPGLRGLVARPNKLKLSALNEKGEKFELVAEGFASTVIQHECDHLEGKLYLDRMTDMTKLAYNQEFERFFASPDDPPSD